MGLVTLEHDEKWEEIVSFGPVDPGTGKKAEFLLYKDGEDTHFKYLDLWIGVDYDNPMLPYEIEKENIQLAITALMADNEIDSVTRQITWINDLSGDLFVGEHTSLSEYLENADSLKAYYRWDSSGKVYQCESTRCPHPFKVN